MADFYFPQKGDKDWTDFVLNNVDEKKEENPTCAGLIQFCNKYFGKILGINVDVVKSPTVQDRSATVISQVSIFEWSRITPEKEDGVELTYRDFIDYETGTNLLFSGAADSNADFLPPPFDQHLVSSIETRALSRALKKAMGVDCYSAEEAIYNDANFEKITDQKKVAICTMMDDLDIDADKFLAKYAGIGPNQLSGIAQKVGVSLLDTLNLFDQTGVPEDLKVQS